MPTSVHIPETLLQQADQRAKALGISRNRLIVRALARELQEGSDWSPGFFERLRLIDDETAAAFEESMSAVRQRRRSKSPPSF
jgi:metal-responsive CopG/Arc/MetJ family transcriptional regulator